MKGVVLTNRDVHQCMYAGVMSVNVTVMTKMVRITHDPAKVSPAVLVSALNGAGLQAKLGKRESSSGIPRGVTRSSVADAKPLVEITHEVERERIWRKMNVQILTSVECLLASALNLSRI